MKTLYAVMVSLFVVLTVIVPVRADVAPMPLGMPGEMLTVILLLLAASILVIAVVMIILAIRSAARRRKRDGDKKQ